MADKPQRSSDAPPGLRRKKSFQGHQYRRKTKPISEQYKADLSKVLGFTVKTNCAFACNEATGYIAFPAGCLIVVCQVHKKKEFHIFNPGHKNLTCIHISLDGQYIVTGESGHLPCVRVFSILERCQVASFQSHKYGISCVSFSPNSQYIVSVGYQHDNVINVWNWRKNALAASNKVSIKIRAVAFAQDSSYFVTVGNRHVKFWYIEQSMVPDTETVPLKGRSGLLEAARNHMFCDVACGIGSEGKFTYALSKTGMLCQFNEKRVLENSIQLETTTAFCMSVANDVIVCGCADGKVLLHSSTDLQLLSSFISEDDVGPHDVIGVSMDSNHMWVHCLHADHIIRVWDVIDYDCPDLSTSCSFHSDCVWDAKALPMSDATNSSFYTCSKDNTVRLWEIEDGNTQLKSNIIVDSVNLVSTPSNPKNVKDEGIRSLCISQDAKLLAVGDRNGVIHVYEINGAVHKRIKQVEMHSGDILSLAFNSSDGTLASASRDRCIYILDASHTPTYTINDHSAAVTAVEFVRLNNKLRLISCGVDKSLYFCTVENTDGKVEIIRDQHIVEKHAMHDMTVVNDSVLVACGGNLREYDIATGKSSRFIRGCETVSTIIRVTTNHDRTIIAISCADKFIYILNYLTGEFLLELGGHSEICAALVFVNSPQMTLVTASADSCIFIWKLTRCAKIDDAVISFQSQLTPHEENEVESNSNTPLKDANATAFFGDPSLNGSISITDPAEDNITLCDPEGLGEETTLEQTACNGDAESEVQNGLNLDTSLPTWLTGQKDKKVKTKKPLGKWASRFQDEYKDIIFLDTPRTTMEWDDINNEDRIMDDPTDESEEDRKEDSDMKEDSTNEECSSKVKEQPDHDATQYYEMVQGDNVASVSTDYASAVEDSEEDKNSPSKHLESLPKKFKSEVAVMINGNFTNKDIKTEEKSESLNNLAEQRDEMDKVKNGPNDGDSELMHEAVDDGNDTTQIHDITELKREDLDLKANAEKPCNVEEIAETNSPEKSINSFKSDEKSSSSPDIPPAFADFLENLGKKKPRSQPNSLPVRSSYNYTKSGGRMRSASDTVSQILSGSDSNSPPRPIHRVEMQTVNGDSSSDECQEAADELMAAYEKAELIYHKVSVENDQSGVSARSLLSNTFATLKDRIDQLQLKIVKEQNIDRMEIDNLPPVLSLLREYSDKLCCMVTEEIRKKDAMKE